MKKTTLILSLILSLLFIAASVFSQNRIITKKKYNSALGNSVSKAAKISNRITRVTNFYKNKVLKSTTRYTSENLPPDKFRWVNIEEKNGAVTSRNERITIANIEYSKKDNGE